MMRLSACSIVYVIAWWFRSSRALFVSARDMKEQIGAENTFVENFPEWLKKILSSLFLALMIVFFYSITCSTASPYTCHHSKIISHIHSAFHVILRFSSLLFLVWISKRNSRIFYVFLFTAPLLKSWKMKMNTSFLHRVFQSFFFVIRKKSSVWIRNWSTRKTNVSLTYVQLYVGAWASRWRYFELHIC